MSLLTVKQQMIYCLPTTATHNAPVNIIKTPIPQIITRKNLIPSCSPHKERNTPRCLDLPNAFPRKANGCNILITRISCQKKGFQTNIESETNLILISKVTNTVNSLAIV